MRAPAYRARQDPPGPHRLDTYETVGVRSDVVPDAAQRSASTADDRRRRPTLTSVLRLVGILAALAAVTFCVKTLVDAWSRIGPAIADASLAWSGVALGCAALAMTGLGLLWWRCLATFGERRPPGLTLAWYFAGELGKYLPGGIWPVVGRGELASRGGVSRTTGYGTTLVAYGCMSAAALGVCGALGPITALTGHLGWSWTLIVLVPVALLAVHPAVLGRAGGLGNRLSRGRLTIPGRSWAAMARLVGWSVPAWVLLGLSSAALTEALGYHDVVPQIVLAAVAAWIIGFLAVPVPAGVGLREIVFIALSGLPTAEGTAVAAGARLLLVVVDALGGVAGLVYVSLRRRQSAIPTESDSEPPVTSATETSSGIHPP